MKVLCIKKILLDFRLCATSIFSVGKLLKNCGSFSFLFQRNTLQRVVNECTLVLYKNYVSVLRDSKLVSCFCLVCSFSSSAMFGLGKMGQDGFLHKQTCMLRFFLCRMKSNYLV